MRRILGLLALSASAALAQSPIVTEILNNYGLTNAGTVAQGAIFIVKGTGLSDETTDLQQVPLTSDGLRGVRMAISVDGITTFAPLYYVLPGQLAGILPSSTPVGTGTLVVRNNSKNSIPVPIRVVEARSACSPPRARERVRRACRTRTRAIRSCSPLGPPTR